MGEPATRPTSASVRAFIDAVEDDGRRRDARAVMKMLKAITGARPRMWGPSIVGYDRCTYTYASGRQRDWPVVAFSPRARNLTVYILTGFTMHASLMKTLGKHCTGRSCLYLNRLDDVDPDVLHELIERTVERIREKHPPR